MGAVDKKSSQLRKRDKRSAYGTTILNWGLRPQTPKSKSVGNEWQIDD